VARRRRRAGDLGQRREQRVHRRVFAGEEIPAARRRPLQRRHVPGRDVFDERVRPEAIPRPDDAGEAAGKMIGHHLHDEIPVGAVAGSVDDARIEDDDVGAAGRGFARDRA
jgi:hypothetical protein